MVYLIYDKKTKLTKIGKSKNPFKRFNNISCGNINAVLVFMTDLYSEKELHLIFKDKRVKKEWFKLIVDDYRKIIKDSNVIPKSLFYRSFNRYIDENYKNPIIAKKEPSKDRITFDPYWDGYFENGLFHDASGKPIKEKCYNGRSCINVNNKRYGVKKLRQYAKKQEVELIEMPF